MRAGTFLFKILQETICCCSVKNRCQISFPLSSFSSELQRILSINNLPTAKSLTSCTGKWETARMHRSEAILTVCKGNKIMATALANDHAT